MSRPAADGLDRLWSPWRMEYIHAELRKSKRAGAARASGSARASRSRKHTASEAEACLFCRVREAAADREHLVLARRPHALLMLNRYPYNPAHLMVAVARHAAQFSELEAAERNDLLDLTALAERALAAE